MAPRRHVIGANEVFEQLVAIPFDHAEQFEALNARHVAAERTREREPCARVAVAHRRTAHFCDAIKASRVIV